MVKRFMFLSIAVGSIAIAALLGSAAAQYGTSTQPLLAPAAIYIWNSSEGTAVNFALSSASCRESSFSLRPNGYGTYSCGRDGQMTISIRTRHANGNVTVKRYRLDATRRYRIYFNRDIAAWDVLHMTGR